MTIVYIVPLFQVHVFVTIAYIVPLFQVYLCDNGLHSSIISGACVCDNGFSGLDCSTDDNAAPEIFRLPRNGLCDHQEWTCRATKVYAYDVFNTGTLVCRTTKFWVSQNIHPDSI